MQPHTRTATVRACGVEHVSIDRCICASARHCACMITVWLQGFIGFYVLLLAALESEQTAVELIAEAKIQWDSELLAHCRDHDLSIQELTRKGLAQLDRLADRIDEYLQRGAQS